MQTAGKETVHPLQTQENLIWQSKCTNISLISVKKEIPVVEQGIFGADMKISLLNDGPFTIILDSAEIC